MKKKQTDPRAGRERIGARHAAPKVDGATPTSEPLGIGNVLRSRRRLLDRTIEEVAISVGVTKGFLSAVERDKASPSVNCMVRLCDVLGIPVGALFEGQGSQVIRADRRVQIRFGGERIRDYLLTATEVKGLMVIWSELEPGGGGGHDLYNLPAEDSFALIVSGSVQFVFSAETFTLNHGDAMTWKSRTPHTFRNASKTKAAVVLFVIAPAPR